MSGRSRRDFRPLFKGQIVKSQDEEGLSLLDQDSVAKTDGLSGSLSRSTGPPSDYLPLSLPSTLDFGSTKPGKRTKNLSAYTLLVFLCIITPFWDNRVDFLQGIPLGLVHGTVPYLLKSKRENDPSFTDLGLFSLAGYPYSLKLLWSPLVDSFFSSRIGRRKSWIIPSQLLIGIILMMIGYRVDYWISHADADIRKITVAFTLLIFCCATQDIAVDGWALTLLNSSQIQYSSTCQTVGLNSGYFTAFTIFLALNSPEFCNYYLRFSSQPTGLLEIASFLKFWGAISMLATFFLAVFKKESRSPSNFVPLTLSEAYKTIYQIVKLPNVRNLSLALLTSRIGYIALDTIVPLKLIEKGFPKEMIALTILIDFPCQLLVGFFVPYLSQRRLPLYGWRYAIVFKLCIAVIFMPVLGNFPSDGVVNSSYFLIVLILTILSSFATTVMFVTMGAFFSVISDPSVGGTYLTLLNTMSNLGGMLPKFVVMSAVDWFTNKNCTEHTCTIIRDGFYIVNTLCISIGGLLTVYYLVPAIRKLEALTLIQWKINTIYPYLAGSV